MPYMKKACICKSYGKQKGACCTIYCVAGFYHKKPKNLNILIQFDFGVENLTYMSFSQNCTTYTKLYDIYKNVIRLSKQGVCEKFISSKRKCS